MKNLITVVFVLLLSLGLNAQGVDQNRFGNFLPGANFSRNLVAKNYVEKGILPSNYRIVTAQTLFNSHNIKGIRITCDPASDFNRNGGYGVLLSPHEKVILEWKNSEWELVAVLVCGNSITGITFIHYDTPGPVYSRVITPQGDCSLVARMYANYLGAYATNDISYEMLLAKYEQIALTQCGSGISFPKRTSTGTIDPPVDYCNKEEGQNKIYEILYTYENFDIFTGKNNAQAKVDAVLRQYSCLAYVKVQRANKLWKKGKPFFIAGAALTAGYLIYKNNRKSNNKEVSWGGNTTSFGKTKFGGNNTF
jgi:hypothetical protein